MMSDVPPHRFEELFLRTAPELRPALTVCDPSVTAIADGKSRLFDAISRQVARRAENVCRLCPGVHARQETTFALSIRFQNVAVGRTRE